MGLTTSSPQAAGVLSGQQQDHLPEAWAALRAGDRAVQVHWDDGVWSLALVLTASAEGTIPGLPQGPRHPCAVGAGYSGGTGDIGMGGQTVPGKALAGTLTTPMQPRRDADRPQPLGRRKVKETLGGGQLWRAPP